MDSQKKKELYPALKHIYNSNYVHVHNYSYVITLKTHSV